MGPVCYNFIILLQFRSIKLIFVEFERNLYPGISGEGHCTVFISYVSHNLYGLKCVYVCILFSLSTVESGKNEILCNAKNKIFFCLVICNAVL